MGKVAGWDEKTSKHIVFRSFMPQSTAELVHIWQKIVTNHIDNVERCIVTLNSNRKALHIHIFPRILFSVTNIHNYIVDNNLFYNFSRRLAMYIYYIILHAHFQEWNENKKEGYDTPVFHIKLVFFVELIQVSHLDVKFQVDVSILIL